VADSAPAPRTPDPLDAALRAAVEAATPARVFLAGSPFGYPTRSWLSLRADHAAARDAVASELHLDDPAMAALVATHQPLELFTAVGEGDYLTRPDLGRILSAGSRDLLAAEAACGPAPTVAIALGDGLSATAAETNGPAMVDALVTGAEERRWTVGRPLVVHRCRVGVLNELGPLLGADVVILLVGERPGLAVADSLSAYLAHRPRPGHTDAERNLVSGIHRRGTSPAEAAIRVLDLTGQLLAAGTSGVAVKEVLGAATGLGAPAAPGLGAPAAPGLGEPAAPGLGAPPAPGLGAPPAPELRPGPPPGPSGGRPAAPPVA
jgi:ethanolamine ammonia-lyase small subunit